MDERMTTWKALAPWLCAGAIALAIAAAFLGSGALGGTPIQDAAGGWLSADGTVLAPGSGAFSIWSVIYLGLAAYAVFQLLPAPRRDPRQCALRPWAAGSGLLNAAWIWVVQGGHLVLSVLVIAVLLAVLVRIFLLLLRKRPASWAERIATDGTFGLYLGWVSVATVANVSAVLAAGGADAPHRTTAVAATVVLAVAAAVGVGVSGVSGGRLAPAAALAWGLAWIAVGRLDGGLESVPVAWSAGCAAAVVAGVAIALRWRAAAAEGVRP